MNWEIFSKIGYGMTVSWLGKKQSCIAKYIMWDDFYIACNTMIYMTYVDVVSCVVCGW
jgi:hypothetical protein